MSAGVAVLAAGRSAPAGARRTGPADGPGGQARDRVPASEMRGEHDRATARWCSELAVLQFQYWLACSWRAEQGQVVSARRTARQVPAAADRLGQARRET